MITGFFNKFRGFISPPYIITAFVNCPITWTMDSALNITIASSPNANSANGKPKLMELLNIIEGKKVRGFILKNLLTGYKIRPEPITTITPAIEKFPNIVMDGSLSLIE